MASSSNVTRRTALVMQDLVILGCNMGLSLLERLLVLLKVPTIIISFL